MRYELLRYEPLVSTVIVGLLILFVLWYISRLSWDEKKVCKLENGEKK